MSEKVPFLSAQGSDDAEYDDQIIPPRPMAVGESEIDGFSSRDNDKAWAIAFKVNVGIVIVSALWFGSMGSKSLANAAVSGGSHLSVSGSGGPVGWIVPMLYAVGVIGIAWAFAWGLLMTLVNCSTLILKVAFLFPAVVFVFTTLSAIAAGQLVAAVVPAILSAVFVMVYLRRQSRIRFGGANLKVAALAMQSMPSTIKLALVMSGVQVLWSILVGVAAFGSMTAFETVKAPDGSSYRAVDCLNVPTEGSISCQCSGDIVAYNSQCAYSGQSPFLKYFWVASFLWGGAVFQNVVSATVAGSVASWWFYPNASRPVQGAFYRATRSSFGSLCKAAAIMGAIRLLSKIARRLGKFSATVRTLLSAVQAVMNYVMMYTISFIGIYGLDFSQAGSRVGELFRKRCVTTLANDAVVEIGLSMLAWAASWGYILIVLAFSPLAAIGGWGYLLLACLGYIACLVVISTTLEVLRSGYKAVFICFVQDPEAFATNHGRRLHDELGRAWEEMKQLNPTADDDPRGTQLA